MLKNILSVTGKSGLFRLVSRGNNMLIVESLEDGKRMPTYARDKIVSLADISMFTTDEDIELWKVLESMRAKYDGKVCDFEAKKADNQQLRDFFATILPNFDQDRVYPSDIRKLISWYNILIKAGFTDFTQKDDDDAETIKDADLHVQKTEHHVQNTQVKTQKAATQQTKTGVGAKKG